MTGLAAGTARSRMTHLCPTPTSSPFAPPPGGATEYLFGCVVLALSEYAQIGGIRPAIPSVMLVFRALQSDAS
jgi:hypothetical protein